MSVPLVAFALLGACGGRQQNGASQEELTGDGAPASPTSPDDDGGQATTTSATTPGASSNAGDGGSARWVSGGGGDGSTTATSWAPGPSNTFAVPSAGTYLFKTTGNEGSPGSERQVSRTSRQVVEYLSGDRLVVNDDTHVVQTRQTSALSVEDDRIALSSMKIEGPGITRTFTANPPVVFIPVPADVGRTWHRKLASNEAGSSTTMGQKSSVARTERISVGGTKIDAVVVESTITFSGDMKGTARLTAWVDPQRGIPVRTHEVSDVSLGAFRVTGDLTNELTGSPPA